MNKQNSEKCGTSLSLQIYHTGNSRRGERKEQIKYSRNNGKKAFQMEKKKNPSNLQIKEAREIPSRLATIESTSRPIMVQMLKDKEHLESSEK